MNNKWRILSVLLVLVAMVIPLIPTQFALAAPADAYWVGGSGTWSDATNHWATSSNGTPDAGNTPDDTTNVHFDQYSFSGAGQVVTISALAACKNMDWTGALYNPTLTITGVELRPFGTSTITLIPDMAINGTGQISIQGTAAISIDANGCIVNALVYVGNDAAGTCSLTLADALIVKGFTIYSGTFTTNNYNMTQQGAANYFYVAGAGAKTITLGSSTINCLGGILDESAAVPTYIANTAIFKLSSTAVFYGNSRVYNAIEFNGTAHTLYQSANITALSFNPSATQTITCTGGITLNTDALSRTGTGQITMQSSNASLWTISDTSGTNTLANVSLSKSTATGGATFNATGASKDLGNNSGWNFTHSTTTWTATAPAMNAAGVTSGTFNGTLDNMGGQDNIVRFDYGLTAAYGSVTSNVTKTTTGVFTAAFSATLTPGATYHYRAVADNGTETVYGGDITFTLTMPTVSTGNATGTVGANTWNKVTLTGNISNMGVATTTNARFLWGYTPALGNASAFQTINAVGDVTAELTGLTGNSTIYYQFQVMNGAVSVEGSQESYSVPAYSDIFPGLTSVILIAPTLFMIGFIVSGFFMIVTGAKRGDITGIIVLGIGIVMFGIAAMFIPILIDGFSAALAG